MIWWKCFSGHKVPKNKFNKSNHRRTRHAYPLLPFNFIDYSISAEIIVILQESSFMKLGDRDTDFTRRLSYSEKLLPRVNSKLAQYRQAGTSRPQDKTYLPALKQNRGRQFVIEVMASQAIHAYQVLDSLYYTIIDNICCLTGSRRLSSI